MHFHGACLLRAQLPKLRERGLSALCRAYMPTLPLSLLSARLGFGADDARGCEAFLRSVGAVPARASGKDEPELDTRAALRTLAARAAAARAEQEQEERQSAQKQQLGRSWAEIGPALPLDLIGGAW